MQCPTVTVPLDHRTGAGATIALNVRRVAATDGAPATTALVPLAGGPGQAAVPLTDEFRRSLAAGLKTRDLVVLDQRGTGGSGPIRCSALGRRATDPAVAARRCAAQLGPKRGLFTTVDSVADLEALRIAGGYAKLALYGVSYGTKVALEYAALHPDRVESLVLDSVVAPEGPDPLQLSTFARVRPALRALCAGRCAQITSDPGRDVARLVSRLRRRALRGRVYDSRGKAQTVPLSRGGLLTTLVAGDLNPALRAQTPAAVHAALNGDSAPLARLRARAAGLVARQASDEDVNQTLYTTTVCEEFPFPWDRAAGPATRSRQAVARVNALRSAQVAPFDRGTALSGGLLPLCVDWPVASPPPPARFTLPKVRALVLGGEQDLRTTVGDAAAVADRLGGRLVVVPDVGHSVLGSDVSLCAQGALDAFYAGGEARPCPTMDPIVAPTRVAPRSLGSLPGTGGLPGRAGETLTAVSRTLGDVRVSVLTKLLAGARSPGVGGLRGGYLRTSGTAIALRGYAFVPGVTVSGTVPASSAAAIRLTVGGSAAAHGTVTVIPSRVSGRLGGRRFSVALARRASVPRPAVAIPRFGRLARIR